MKCNRNENGTPIKCYVQCFNENDIHNFCGYWHDVVKKGTCVQAIMWDMI
jgi:hypothetical protein